MRRYDHGHTQPKIAGGGAVRGSEGHPADDDDLASEKGHLLAKRAFFPRLLRRQPPPARYGPDDHVWLSDIIKIMYPSISYY